MADWPSGFVLLAVVPLVALVFFGCASLVGDAAAEDRSGGAKVRPSFPDLRADARSSRLRTAAADRSQQNFRWHRKTANGSWRGSKPAN
jgi:hypothetical protein